MKAEDLSCAHVYTQSVDVDWANAGYDRGWEPVWPATHLDGEDNPIEDEPVYYCDMCAEGWREDDLDIQEDADVGCCPDCGHAIATVLDPIGFESLEPAMSYHWPVRLPRDACEAATAQAVLDCGSVALIAWNDGGHSIVLTGGGMDLSWDICAAYVACGQLPPVALSGLPALAGHKPDQSVVAAMIRSCEAVATQVSIAAKQIAEQFSDERLCASCQDPLADPQLMPGNFELCAGCGS